MIKLKPTEEHIKVLGLVILGIFAILLSFPLDNFMASLFDSIENNILQYVFESISNAIFLIFVLLIMTSLFMWEENKKDWIIPLWFSFFIAILISYAIKITVARDRPGEEEIFLFGWIKDYAFPSSHAIATFASLPILDKEYPMLKWFWIIIAAMIAISRLYLDMHYFSDVIAGAVIGYAIGKTVVHMKEKYSLFN